MIANKHIDKIVSVIVALAVALCFAAMWVASKPTAMADSTGIGMEYETELFWTDSPITVNILMDETEWKDMLGNASAESYYRCNVEINGETFYEVGIRPKGNTSLSSIASNPDTDRYSFKLEFDQFVDGQTCYGLDKLILNNNYADATNMKEALIYDMYQYIGADASLYNYASVHVNGEYWGVYLALEAVEDSFLLRNYGVSDGELYKPDSMDFDRGAKSAPENAGKMEPPENADRMEPPENAGKMESPENIEMEGFTPHDMGGGPGGFSAGGNGANLNYVDDDPDSYSSIWDGEVTKTNKSDHKRVVEALKNIFEGTDLEKYMDIDNLLRYMAVHVFSVNSDSLTGNMAHNYYLYENNGKLNMIPWDYNLALGGMGGGGDASSVINDAVDGAFSATGFFDTLMENEEYNDQYHAYLEQLVTGYMNGGAFDEFYNRTRAMLDELVETDPTAFYTFEEYSDAADTLYEVVKLRGKSVEGQINGTIPSTESAQRQNPDSLIDTGNIDLSIMGTMDMGNGDMGGGGGFKGFGGGFNFGEGFLGGSGAAPAQFDSPPDKHPDGFEQGGSLNGDALPQKDPQVKENGEQFRMERHDRGDMSMEQFPGENPDAGADFRQYIILGISVVLLIAALVFVTRFKRK